MAQKKELLKHDISFILKEYISTIDESNQEEILEKISKIRYEDGRYIFIFKHFPNEQKIMPLVNPNITSIVGKKLEIDKLIDKNNQLYIKHFLETLKIQDDAFFEYGYKEPKSEHETKKLSYIYHCKLFDWYIGTGIHVHNLDEYLASQVVVYESNLKNIILKYLTISLILIILSYILIYLVIRYINKKQFSISQYENIISHMKKKIDMSYFIFDIKSRKLVFVNDELNGEYDIEYIEDFLKYISKNDYEDVKLFFEEKIEDNKERNIHFRMEFRGEIKYLDCYTNLIVNNHSNKNKLMVTLIDITSYKKNEIKYLNRYLFKIQNKIENDFFTYINMIAHQWRHPISYINSKLIDIYLDSFDKKTFIDDIERTTELLSQTINDFNSIFSNDNISSLIELDTIIKDVIKIFHTKLINVEITLDFTTEDRLLGSRSKLQQVLMIIIKNSLEAHEKNEIKTPKLSIQTAKKFNTLILTLEDNAKGILNEDIEKVFDIYYTTKDNDNKGLGLYMAKLLIEKFFKGTIRIKNTQDGLKTSIFLPIPYTKDNVNV